MLVGTVVVIAFGRRAEPAKKRSAPRALVDRGQWLSREAERQVVADGGAPGPLFASLTLGGSAPTALEREHIAAFARENHIEIDLDTHDDTLEAIHVAITYGGCCGYEGVDVLARRAGQVVDGGGCMGPARPRASWANVLDDGTHVRGKIHLNHIELTWRRVMPLPEALAITEGLLGQSIHSLRGRRGFVDRGQGSYLLELPLPYDGPGVELVAARGVVHTVLLDVMQFRDDDRVIAGARECTR